MGVHGLWRLIEPSGKPVPLETLENKVLAVDISIWLHQAVKGFQDARGAPMPNAHLLGIYHRVCKLLYFRIKPIFVFDGGVPVLKKQTIARRSQNSAKIRSDASSIQQRILTSLLKHSAIQKVLSEEGETNQTTISKNILLKNKTKDDLFMLPEAPISDLDSTLETDSTDYTETETSDSSPTKQWDLHTIDEKSPHFLSLPPEVRHDILTDLKEQRKQSSWGRLHELPKQSGDFSQFQMKRLLKRYSVQTSLEEATREMGGHTLSLNELEALLKEEGIVTATNKSTNRIASDENKSYLLIKDVKKAMEKAKKEEQDKITKTINEEEKLHISHIEKPNDSEYERDLQEAIKLSLMETPSTSKESDNCDYFLGFNDGDFDSSSESEEELYILPKKSRSAAERYMLEYADLTPYEVDNLFKKDNKPEKNKSKKGRLAKVNEENNDIDKQSESHIITDLSNENKSKVNENESNLDNINILEESNEKSIDKTCMSTSEYLHPVETKDHLLQSSDLTSNENNLKNNAVLASTEIMSDSSDDFVEVKNESPKRSNLNTDIKKSDIKNEKQIESALVTDTIELMSDSDDTDFEEVVEKSSQNKTNFEVVIDPLKNIEDDIFKDIFDTVPKKIETQPNNIPKIIEIQETIPETKPEIVKVSVIKENKIESEQNSESNKNKDVVKKTVTFEEEVLKKDDSSKIEKVIPKKPKLSKEELNNLQKELVQEQQELMIEKNAKERMAGDITNQMYQEAQELLELFGVPYIIAPMEAEAQCAFLNSINLTDGTITDDSDIWLFGGNTVYKNFFNQKKHVLEYRDERIKQYFKLTREQMILLALLVGSDYTIGIQGIGPVTALEILAAFPPARNPQSYLSQSELLTGLSEFKHWLTDGGKLGLGRTTLRSKLHNIQISEGFPSLQVVQAYLQPEVETSDEQFSWGKPDVVALIDFAREKFGWTRMKTEEILNPVIKKLEDVSKQKSIRDYFAIKHKIDIDLSDGKVSKRVKKAIEKMGKSREEIEKEEQNNKKGKNDKTNKDKNIKNPRSRTTNKEKSKTQPEIDNSTNKTSEITEELSGIDNLIRVETVVIKSKNNSREKTKKSQTRSDDKPKTVRTKAEIHKKEPIPQREKDKASALKSKLKAIEIFRKSKIEGKHDKKKRSVRQPKADAELSESSDSS